MPSGIIKHQDDPAFQSGTYLLGEQNKHGLEQPLGDAVGKIPEALPGRGRDKGSNIEPLEAVMTNGCRSLPLRCPDTADHGFEPDAMLIGRESLDHRFRMGGLLLGDGLGEFFLKTSSSSGVAAPE